MGTALLHTDQTIISYTIAAVALPLTASLINFCLPVKSKAAGWISTLAILVGCVLSAIVFARVWNQQPLHTQKLWFTIGNTKVFAGILLNNLSALMLLLVSLIALPVHIYSTAYMKHDDRYSRYFTYLSFFCFSMLALVVADSMVLFYAFWELVGFSSYLLIGFWFTKDKAVQANKKAFIMNRIGDIGLLSAIIIIFAQFHTFDIDALFGQHGLVKFMAPDNGQWAFAPDRMPSNYGSVWTRGAMTTLPAIWQYIACAGIFLAVAAKSAQFPLHTWLPDAMEGPTSVSALIHAATMVAAGVFLLGRVYPLFTDTELTVLAVIGCFTAFMAATIALTQNDLKRVLAYSTISQLGYMILAMGVGAYGSSLFHLATHAFFKCLLFLVAGVVIHEMQHIKEENNLDIDPQNIQYMGGLRKKLPLTFIVAIVGSLALIGIPLTSGYLSKDGILIQAFEWSEGRSAWLKLIPAGALFTSWLTAFYVSRLIVKIFFGEFRLLKHHPDIKLHISDGGWQYRVPLILLAVCSLFPLFSLNPFFYEKAWLFESLKPAEFMARENIYHTIIPIGVNILSVFVMYAAYAIYVKRNTFSFPQTGFFYRLSYNQWYLDKIYKKLIVKPILGLGKTCFWFDRNIVDGLIYSIVRLSRMVADLTAWCDKYIVDGFLHSMAALVQSIGNFARKFQNGKVQYYLYSMLLIVLVLFILKILI
ncbi:NADH-quinone oxidoreductase subunit L [Mucilaginibacter rubeus]|uniref:NADH-quinone oxidoreductase subunit L n=1 Tax=Mucilaginibacter rubeus TaxID=2027860 RepID=A0AAE6JGP2_9SPHI|nr:MULTISPECIES: NADH-quinone oxidoreductase subunit L [Mucilaginibacter]QEM05382.1 NADH-quinone oxidoreductase subunit L [Mucilaginibacter rubeus]QEM17971.1 NADH-quinone oxidoreductase subunit L [Mucilaginibacter gossypii]QTE45495.1 NADH-quinone oxidoreductase subunit L [Mucilaginibacter rubeus]QTE52092.1 NADH-quinone oxidoreductase subunit L [Mucilaginibacter rubeus]QTE57180.1 NADH-quinone oxidoreductase subunit L [Mucilaginibacter rubeus]